MYPPEFRNDAVAMVLDEGRAIADVARAVGVNEGTLGNWVAKERVERGLRDGLIGHQPMPAPPVPGRVSRGRS